MIQQKFKANRELLNIKDIVISDTGNGMFGNSSKENIIRSIPQIYYYGVEFPMSNVSRIDIDNNKFIPTCYVIFDDVLNIIHNIGMPKDDSYVTIILPTNDDFFANMFLQFKIQSYHIESKPGQDTKKVHMQGVLSIDNLLTKDYKSYDMTSYQLFEQFAKECGLGFKSNVNNSSDKMPWLRPGIFGYDFLKQVLDKSWISESSYVFGFVDLYYDLNYIDIERSLEQDINMIDWISTSADRNKSTIIKPFLSNDNALIGSNTYFTGEKIINQSTGISLDNGYIRNVSFYDIDGNWKDKAGSYKEYQLDTITTPGSESTSIILKGEPGNIDFYNKNKSYHWLGKLDTKNMHPDYLWAKVQNKENLKDLSKISMQIFLPKINFNIKRFEKTQLFYVNNNENIKNDYDNKLLNGEWLVSGQSLHWNGQSYSQKVNIVKRELEIT